MKCRHCGTAVRMPLIDLGSAPLSNGYLTEEALHAPETWYPLKVMVCTECWLVQTEDYAHCSELFSDDYAYFSSFSATWLQHAERYVASMAARFRLGPHSHVVEVASNDGYLLQYVQARGIPCLGIEPTASTAQAARNRGIAVIGEFFGSALARRLVQEGLSADVMAANNVLAHVPDINDFVAGFALLLKSGGVATFEFPHVVALVRQNQFDTIYHEHFSYLSFTTVKRIFSRNGLTVFDVERLATHGGSLRVYAQRSDTGEQEITARVDELLAEEQEAGVTTKQFYADFQDRADQIKNDLQAFLIAAKRAGKRVAAYGAAAKGNTLLNYAGIRPDLVAFVVDRNPAKQGKYLPGSRIPIVGEEMLLAERPEYILILPWNLKGEIVEQLRYVHDWSGQMITFIPQQEMV